MLIFNDILAFVLEIAAIILYGMIAYQQSDHRIIKVLLVVIAIAVFAIIWGRFFAPTAPNALQGWLRWVLEFIILFLPWVIYFHNRPTYIVIGGVIIIANLAIQALIGRSNLG